MKRLLVALALVTVTGCSRAELAAWVAWHQQDPAAAVAFAQQLPTEVVEPATAWTVNWDRVAACESGGDWSHPPVRNSTGVYSGGLQVGHRWWPAFGGTEFAPYPYQATKAEQIIVAERIVDANGGGYAGADRGWQCVR